ncbi:MAG: MFS transporter [Proteobacteria bacterium]|nr:MFS transporter [Pseudomonadota bacterium]
MPARHIETSPIGRSAMRKAFWRILPLILLAYLFAYMDRVNVSFAAATMNADLGFSATTYGLGGGLFFLSYALFAVPSNLLLVRFGAPQWIALIMATWGLLSAGMMLVRTPMEFYTLRFLLGVAEAGFYPGVITYFAVWFPPCHRSRAVSRFCIASPLAAMAMGGMAGSLLGLEGHGGLHGWQWLFVAQGLPSALIGLLVLLFLPDRPETSTWLSSVEKQWVSGELAREQAAIGAPPSATIMAAFRNPLVLISGITGIMLIGTVITMSLSAPIVLAGATGLDPAHVGYLVGLGGIVGVVTLLLLGNYADRIGDRLLLSSLCGLVMATALAVILAAPSALAVALAYLAFAAVCFAMPMLNSSNWADMFHVQELAVCGAAINTFSQIGAFVAPFAWGAARDATGNFDAGLAALVALSLGTAALTMILRNLLRRNQVRRAAALA